MTARVLTWTRSRQAGWGGRKNIALWVLQVVVAVAVFGVGASTVVGAAQPVQMFHEIGLGDWFRYLTGVLQLAGAVGLLIPRLCGLAGLAFVGMWLVAFGTHLFVIGGDPMPAVVFLVLTAVIAWGRRDHTADLLARPAQVRGSNR
jgi:putative oxidoreductase